MVSYKTYDLWQATILKIKGFTLLAVHINGNSRALFEFEDRPEREQLLLDFVNRKLSVEPLGFVDAMKSLKALTYVDKLDTKVKEIVSQNKQG